MVIVTDRLAIPVEELTFTASRSSGPGGQNVNKLSTRVSLLFDVLRSPSLAEDQKQRILVKLRSRISKDGVLRVSCQQSRSQAANRDRAVERFVELLQQALIPRRPRKKTTVPGSARERRLEEKKRRGRLKAARTGKASQDG
jgi:ribosome-associated protein